MYLYCHYIFREALPSMKTFLLGNLRIRKGLWNLSQAGHAQMKGSTINTIVMAPDQWAQAVMNVLSL